MESPSGVAWLPGRQRVPGISSRPVHGQGKFGSDADHV
jgi:hypothetical protein